MAVVIEAAKPTQLYAACQTTTSSAGAGPVVDPGQDDGYGGDLDENNREACQWDLIDKKELKVPQPPKQRQN